MLHTLTDWLISLATQMPLLQFTFVGSFVEELIAPIPSPIILTVSGTMAAARGWPWSSLLLLALVGAAGKTLGAVILYVVADKIEDVVLGRLGRFIGLSHSTVEKVGATLKKGGKDIWVLLVLRATPVMPSAPLSALCGILKIRFVPFVIMTFVGSVVRDLAFLALGYAGLDAGHALISGTEKIESMLTAGLVVAILGFLVWCYAKRRRWLKD